MSHVLPPLSRKWRAIAERPYAPVTADDGRAAGGVVLVQARRVGDVYELRRVASNGGAVANGPPESVEYDALRRIAPDLPPLPVLYECVGSVRGSCGHRHRSLAAAVACLRDDSVGCARQGGYTDREVVRCDGADMSEGELAALYAAADRLNG